MARQSMCGSEHYGELATGCKHCIKGAKMVLFVTGRCGWNCFYCPVSLEKKGLDVIYANEALVHSDDEIIAEARSMDATGTGITGGDPLCVMERTLHMIRLLKDTFGPEHHIHLYTATMDPDKVRVLSEAGLDEIRFHPPERLWEHMEDTPIAEIAAIPGIDVGIEVPALVGFENELSRMVEYAKSVGVDFVNMNELEFSESNWDMMSDKHYEILDDVSSAVKGSRETALKVLNDFKDYNIHFCSSPFKDGVQLRRRLIRKAEIVRKPYQEVTDDGTLIRGFLVTDDISEGLSLIEKVGTPDGMYEVLDGMMEIAPRYLERIAKRTRLECYLSEQYPTADGLEVERTPLN